MQRDPIATQCETRQAPGRPTETWRFRTDSPPAFDPIVFDASALESRGWLTGVADAGRGGTVFFDKDGVPLVLREYRRGGLVRKVSRRAYVSFGRERSRAMREFALLLELERRGLPAPRVYAARCTRHGLVETGELVTHRLDGVALPAWLAREPAPDGLWQKLGQCIALFHAEGVEHADLNAHNVLWQAQTGTVQLLDFDRGRLHPAASATPSTVWARRNLARLARSFERLNLMPEAAAAIEDAWREALQSARPSAIT